MTLDIVVTIVQSSQEDYYMCQRAPDRKWFPSLWVFGADGKVEPNEKRAMAAQRELKEELDIAADPRYLFSFPFRWPNPDLDFIVHIYHLMHDGEIKFCQREYVQGKWMSPGEVNEIYLAKQLTPDDTILWEYLQSGVLPKISNPLL